MKDWKPYKLNELGKVGRGKSKHRPRNEPSLFGGKYPFIQTGDVKSAEFYISDYSQTYSEKGLAQSKLWKKGTLCITIAANIAETAILNIDACFPDSIIGFVADEKKSDVKFIKYHFDLLKLHLQSISQGTTQDNLSQEKLLKFDFTVPIDVKHQQRIASILSAYDDLIEVNNQRIKLLEQTTRELYKEWFVRMRFPGYKQAKFKKGVPEGWEVKPISAIVKFLSGYSFKSSFYAANGKFGIVTIKNVQDGHFVSDCTDYIEALPKNLKEYCILNTGDVLMSLTGNVGRVCHVIGDNILLNQRVAKLKPLLTDKTHFIYCFFRENSMIQFMENISLGSTAQMNLSPIQLGKQKVIVPDSKLIKTFDEMVDPYFKNKYHLIRANEMLREIRDRLLPRLISGKLEVKEVSSNKAAMA